MTMQTPTDPWSRLRQLRAAEQEAERACRQAHEEERRLKQLWGEARRRTLAFLDTGAEAEPLFDLATRRFPARKAMAPPPDCGDHGPVVGLCQNCCVRTDDDSGPGALCGVCDLKAREKAKRGVS